MRRFLDLPDHRLGPWVAVTLEIEGSVRSWGKIHQYPSSSIHRIHSLDVFTHPNFRCRGYGRYVARALLAYSEAKGWKQPHADPVSFYYPFAERLANDVGSNGSRG